MHPLIGCHRPPPPLKSPNPLFLQWNINFFQGQQNTHCIIDTHKKTILVFSVNEPFLWKRPQPSEVWGNQPPIYKHLHTHYPHFPSFEILQLRKVQKSRKVENTYQVWVSQPSNHNKHLSPFTSLVSQLKSSNSTIFFLRGLHIIFHIWNIYMLAIYYIYAIYICLTVVVVMMEGKFEALC